jgi:hypothetical protein
LILQNQEVSDGLVGKCLLKIVSIWIKKHV